MENNPSTLLQLNDMTRAYLMTALGEPMEEGLTKQFKDEFYLSDFDKSTMDRALFDCAKFKRDNENLLNASDLDEEGAGEVFWHYRNLEKFQYEEIGKGWEIMSAIHSAARTFGNIYVYVGIDWKLYFD